MASTKTIVRILKQFDIPYWLEGKNVSIDSVNIKCPFCDDPSNHLGIFIDSLKYHCWRCTSKGVFSGLLVILTGLSEKECKDLISSGEVDFKRTTLEQIEDRVHPGASGKVKKGGLEVKLPEFSELVQEDTNFSLLDDFLNRRNISLEDVIEHYCSLCRVGSHMNRLIVPVYFKGVLVSYQAVDMTGKAWLRYKTAPGKINDFLYCYDDVRDRMILTEGVFDAWRVGEGAVATFGTHITEKQKNLILAKGLRELIFCWDEDAFWEARKQSNFFAPFVKKICIIRLPYGEDPDSYGREETLELIEQGLEE